MEVGQAPSGFYRRDSEGGNRWHFTARTQHRGRIRRSPFDRRAQGDADRAWADRGHRRDRASTTAHIPRWQRPPRRSHAKDRYSHAARRTQSRSPTARSPGGRGTRDVEICRLGRCRAGVESAPPSHDSVERSLAAPRFYSMMHIAMFDAANSVERDYSRYRVELWHGVGAVRRGGGGAGRPRRPGGAAPGESRPSTMRRSLPGLGESPSGLRWSVHVGSAVAQRDPGLAAERRMGGTSASVCAAAIPGTVATRSRSGRASRTIRASRRSRC